MTPQLAQELLGTLNQQPLGIDDLHGRARLSGSPWSRDQLELFLLCLAGIERDDSGNYHQSGRSTEDELQAEILEVVRSFAGRPVSAEAVRLRLPNHFVTTNEQVLAVVRRSADLEVFGPNLIRIPQ